MVNYTFTATGSMQPATSPYQGASAGPFRFYGEAALDPQGNAYVASSDTNPQGPAYQRVGTLDRLGATQGPTATATWATPLMGETVGAVLYAANPLTPTQSLVVVADRFPEVVAFDAATGARVWTFAPPGGVAPFDASPALSPDGRTLYPREWTSCKVKKTCDIR